MLFPYAPINKNGLNKSCAVIPPPPPPLLEVNVVTSIGAVFAGAELNVIMLPVNEYTVLGWNKPARLTSVQFMFAGVVDRVKLVCTPLPVKLSTPILVLDPITQFRLPAPSVLNTYVFEPPVMCKLLTFPKLTLAPLSATLPVVFNVPATLTPVPVITIFVLPTAVKLILPFAVGIFTLLFPLLILLPPPPPPVCATQERLPEPTAPNVTLAVVVKSTIPVALLIVKPVKLPTDVIFGCAFVYTVPEINALAT
jgi:hypothetical protein